MYPLFSITPTLCIIHTLDKDRCITMDYNKNDYNMMYTGLIGKVFYNRCGDDSRYYRTVRISHNPFTNSLVPQISNPVYGTPPDGLEPMNPHLLSRLLRMKQSMNMTEF